jgi:fructose-1,6-bisphosphatase/inositol monophosphatase family enzyme
MFKGAERAAFDRLAEAVRSPLFGGDCFNYGQVASGYMDLVVEASLKPFDFAALVPILAGAGGLCTDWQGRALGLGSDGHVIAAGDARVHAAAAAMLAA